MHFLANQLQAQVDRLVSAIAELSPRALRATALMAVAVIGIAATSLYYLRPWAPRPAVIPVRTYIPPSPRQTGGREIQYEVVSAALVWAVMVDTNGYGGPGSYWLFRTVDGGKHWSIQAKGKTADMWSTAISLHFVDRRTAFFAGGDPLTLRKTADGGQNWTTLALPLGSFQSIQFIDSIHGWLVSGAPESLRLYSTRDGGASWIRLPDPPPDLMPGPAFRDESGGWSGSSQGSSPHVYSTGDGGRTWQTHDLPKPADRLPGLNFSSWVRLIPGEGMLVSLYGGTDAGSVVNLAFTTMDGGATWIPFEGPSSDSPGAVSAFQDSTHWWAIFGPDLYKSSDAGSSWTHFDAVTPANMELIRVLDSRHAWGEIYDDAQSFDLGFTADGGLHWTRVKAPTTN